MVGLLLPWPFRAFAIKPKIRVTDGSETKPQVQIYQVCQNTHNALLPE